MLLGTCGVGRSSDGSLDVMQDYSVVHSLRQHSAAAMQDAAGTLSITMQPSTNNTDGHVTSFATEQVAADKCNDSSVRHDSATVSETSHRNSATVELNCSVVDTMSRNHCSKMQTARRKSLSEAIMANLSVTGQFDATAEQCQRSAWRRTKSYDMSACEVTVL